MGRKRKKNRHKSELPKSLEAMGNTVPVSNEATEKKPKESDLSKSFRQNLDSFSTDLCALRSALPVTMEAIETNLVRAIENLENLIATTHHTHSNEGDQIRYEFRVGPNEHLKFRRINDELSAEVRNQIILPESFLNALVSKYDAYIGNLMRIFLMHFPQILKDTNKSISYADILEFSSFEDAQKHIIEEEVDSVLRDSHIEQLNWFSKKLKIPVTPKSLSKFVEITERRNLLTHCNGVVNKHYLNNCKESHVELSKDAALGNRLSVDPEYYTAAFITLYEIGFQLGHIVWRKIGLPEDLDHANAHYLMQCYDLIVMKEYQLVVTLLNFVLNEPAFLKDMSERELLINNLNLAQAYKKMGKDSEAQALLKKIDWKAKSPEFQLAYHVLDDDFLSAASLMKAVEHSSKVIKPADYREWPLFDQFRTSEIFITTYEELFGHAYTETVTVPEDFPRVSRLMKNQFSKKQKKNPTT